MKYLEWNNLIGTYLFNEHMAGKEVYLFLTKQDIIHIGKISGRLTETNDTTIWEDFMQAIRTGLPGEPPKIDYPGKLEYAFQKVKVLNMNGIQVLFPPYLSYLALTVLPILEAGHSHAIGTFRANNYYAHIRSFLNAHRLPELPNLNQIRNWNHIWQHLSNWTIQIKKTDLGIFQAKNFSPAWVYAGLPLSQCLINPKALKRLPEVFLKEGLTPNCFISNEQWKTILERTWIQDLRQRPDVLEHISQGDEMGKVVLEIVKQVHEHWQGETEIDEEAIVPSIFSPVRHIKKADIRARLHLSFKIEKSTGDLKWGCRMYSKYEYPEDLSFSGIVCRKVRENWSNQLELGFHEKANLKDSVNKWEIVLPAKDLRLFIGGATLNLNSDYWVETDHMSRINPMHLLCKNDRRPSIKNWGKHFQFPGYFKELTNDDYGGIPEDWSLFKFQYPKEGIEGEPAMQLSTTKKILLVGGLQTGNRIYQKSCLPEVVVENGNDTETPFLELIPGGRRIPLQKQMGIVNRWLLPDDLNEGDEFKIDAEAEKTYIVRIDAEKLEALHLDNSLCPKRNRFGLADEKTTNTFVQGSLLQGFDFTRQIAYEHFFQPGKRSTFDFESSHMQLDPENDLLLEFLTRKKITNAKKFLEAYENVLYRKITGELDEARDNLTVFKRQALNWYDFLGYIDYDRHSNSKQIVINPPQLFLVPTHHGRKAFLTGARTPNFTHNIFEKAAELGLDLHVIPQAGANKTCILLPNSIFVEARNLPGYGMAELRTFAKQLNIYFDPEHIIQWGLLNFSAGIDDYAKSLVADEWFEDFDCPKKVFSQDKLTFERIENNFFSKTFSLVKYEQNTYTYHYILWKNGKPYRVDEHWGRWLVLQYNKRQVVFRDENAITAIPSGMPLPRLISEAFMLCSGKIPEQKYLEINGIKTIFSLYDNVVKIMLDNEFSRIGQKLVHVHQIF